MPFLVQHLPKKSVRILELCAGTGRVAIPLAQYGHRVTGMEYDAAMVDIARGKAQFVGLKESECEFVVGDVLKSTVPGQFDWAVILFNTFLNFTTASQQSAFLKNVHAQLAPKGHFWMDIFNPDLSIVSQDHIPEIDIAEFYVPEIDRMVRRHTELKRSKKLSQLQHMTFHYQWQGMRQGVRKSQISFDMTYFFPRELQLLLETHGFDVVKMYGNYNGEPVHADSPRIIIKARKR